MDTDKIMENIDKGIENGLKRAAAKSKLNDGVIKPCCANCRYFGYAPPRMEQPYAEFWCKEEVWGGMDSMQALYEETDCILYEKAL